MIGLLPLALVIAAPIVIAVGGVVLIQLAIPRRFAWSDAARGCCSMVGYAIACSIGSQAGSAWIGRTWLISASLVDWRQYTMAAAIVSVLVFCLLISIPLGVILPVRMGSITLRSDFAKRGRVLRHVALAFVVGAAACVFMWSFNGGRAGFVGYLASPKLFPRILFGFLVVGWCEEMFFRWQILGGLTALTRRPYVACTIQALLFAIAHVPALAIKDYPLHSGLGMLGLLWLAVFGFVMGVLRLRTGVLMPCYIAHAITIALGSPYGR